MLLAVLALAIEPLLVDGQQVDSAAPLAATVQRGWLEVTGLAENGPMPKIEVKCDGLDPFEKVEQVGTTFRFKLPDYRGSQLLAVCLVGTIYRGNTFAGTVRFDYPSRRFEREVIGITVGFTHREANYGGQLIGFPLNRAARQNPPATVDAAGRRLSIVASVLGHVSPALGWASVDDYKGPGFAYGIAIRVPGVPPDFFLRDLRLFVGQRVRAGQYGRLLWGVAYSKKL